MRWMVPFFLFLSALCLAAPFVRADDTGYSGTQMVVAVSDELFVIHYHDWSGWDKLNAFYFPKFRPDGYFTKENDFSWLEVRDAKTNETLFRLPTTAMTHLWISPDSKYIVGLSNIKRRNPYQLIVVNRTGKLIHREHIATDYAVLTEEKYRDYFKRYPYVKRHLKDRILMFQDRYYLDLEPFRMPNTYKLRAAKYLYEMSERISSPYSPHFSGSVTNWVTWYAEPIPKIQIESDTDTALVLSLLDPAHERFKIRIPKQKEEVRLLADPPKKRIDDVDVLRHKLDVYYNNPEIAETSFTKGELRNLWKKPVEGRSDDYIVFYKGGRFDHLLGNYYKAHPCPEGAFLEKEDDFLLEIHDANSSEILAKVPVPPLTYLRIDPECNYIIGLSFIRESNPIQVLILDHAGCVIGAKQIVPALSVLTRAEYEEFQARYTHAASWLQFRRNGTPSDDPISFDIVGMIPRTLYESGKRVAFEPPAQTYLIEKLRPTPYGSHIAAFNNRHIFFYAKEPKIIIEDETDDEIVISLLDPLGKRFLIRVPKIKRNEGP